MSVDCCTIANNCVLAFVASLASAIAAAIALIKANAAHRRLNERR
jgi:hypothetical protein